MTAPAEGLGGYEAEPEEARAVTESEIEDIAAAWPGDPLARYAALTARQAHYQAVSEGLAEARAALVREMNAQGASYGRIAEMTGLTRARVQQLAGRGKAVAATGEFDLLTRP